LPHGIEEDGKKGRPPIQFDRDLGIFVAEVVQGMQSHGASVIAAVRSAISRQTSDLAQQSDLCSVQLPARLGTLLLENSTA